MNILDNDLYKFTMWNAVSHLYPNVTAKYKEYDRNKQLDNSFNFYDIFMAIQQYSNRDYTKKLEPEILEQIDTLKQKFPQINWGQFQLEWYRTLYDLNKWKNQILWEVPFLYTNSEKYYKKHLDSRFLEDSSIINSTLNKLNRLNEIGKYYNRKVVFSELGTRRRISHNYQDLVLNTIKENINAYEFLEFKGTSNIWFGLKHNIPIVGTMAHEWVQAHSVLNSIQNANYYALKTWMDFYPNDFKVALTDTYGIKNFFRTFDSELSSHFKTLRHDSGDPLKFIDTCANHYGSNTLPTLLFSDSVNDGVVETIFRHVKDGDVNVEFGIGTWFTAKPYDNFETLNIVLKLDSVNGIPVCKLSDSPGKESGDKNTIELTKSVLNMYGDLK